jgi:hypothetical protein
MSEVDLKYISEKTIEILEKTFKDFGVEYSLIPQENDLPYYEIKGKLPDDKVCFYVNNLLIEIFYSDPQGKIIDERLKDEQYLTSKIYGVVLAKIRSLLLALNYEGEELTQKLKEMTKRNNLNLKILRKDLNEEKQD